MQKLKNIFLKTLLFGFSASIFFFVVTNPAKANPLNIKLGDSVNIEGDDTSYDNLSGVAKAVGNVRINCGDTDIYAGTVSYTHLRAHET